MAKNKNKKIARTKSSTKSAGTGAGAATVDGTAEAASTVRKKRVSPMQFIAQVRSEMEKVTWPTFSEWRVTTLMVFAMVVVASLFFYFVDIIIKLGVTFLFGLGG